MAENKLEKFKGMIPQYLKGDLPASESREFEQALQAFPELQQELREYQEIRDSYRELDQEMPAPPENLYHRITQNIRKEEAAWHNRGIDFLKNLFASPRPAWAMVAVFLVISTVLFLRTPSPGFTTLSDGTKLKPGTIQVNIIFQELATEKELRDLMFQAKARIINGPDINGLYVLESEAKDQKDHILATLQKAAIVRMAEIRY